LIPRSSPPNRSSSKTDAQSRLPSALRARARSAFFILLAGYRDADQAAQGALSRDREHAVYPNLVTAILRFVIVLFAEGRDVSSAPHTLHSLHRSLGPSRQGMLFDTHDAWTRVLAIWQYMHDSFPRATNVAGQALFNPAATPFLAAPFADVLVYRVLDALLVGDGTHVDFAELDLEHVGTFYEGLMAFDSLDARIHYDISAPLDERHGPSDDRRRLGAHYTSRAMTQVIVEKTLGPLVSAAKSPEALFELRICDPAMGSGAFLLEACRYLSGQLMRMWGSAKPSKSADEAVDTTFRARRFIVRHCLYGVDKNPRAAELARWALWLATVSPRSLGVLPDEQLRAGDSLVGRPGGEDWFSSNLPLKLEKRAQAFFGRHSPFHWEEEFANVMARGGFDAFVGNPPWVSYAGRAAQPIEDDLRSYYSDTNPAFSGYRNLQGLFLFRCANLLKPGGRLGFVLPSSMSELAGYAPTRRAHEALCECDDDLADFGNVFDDVFQPCMALVSTRRSAPIEVENPKPWPLHRSDLDASATLLLERMATLPTLPADLFGERGFQSMGDDVQQFKTLDGPSSAFPVGVRVGGDIEPFLRRSPKFHCDPSVFGARFRPVADWQNISLLIRQTARFPIAALSDGQAFRNSILAGFSSEVHRPFFLLAWLNSSPIRWYHYTRNRDARQGMPQVKIAHLRAIPAPLLAQFIPPIETFGRTLGERNAGISPDEQATLDVLVADALALDANERLVIGAWVTAMNVK
jgi:N-6 DNA Methylase